MNADVLAELVKLGGIVIAVAMEWWIMQPYHEPLLARAWLYLMTACHWVAYQLGRLGIIAEHQYYMAVEAGL